MNIYTDKRLLRTGLIGGTLSRQSGNMREWANQSAVLQKLALEPSHLLHFHQVHGNAIISVANAQQAQEHTHAPIPDADGWIFSPFPPNWGAAIVTADCVPLFVWDDTGTYAALAHCGWRGTVQKLPYKTVQALLIKNPQLHLNAWLGPHIQACCFEVQEEVAKQFTPPSRVHRNGKCFVNLNTEIKYQLTQAGLQEKDIYLSDACTCCDKINFFSWRRDHEKNLLLSFIYKP